MWQPRNLHPSFLVSGDPIASHSGLMGHGLALLALAPHSSPHPCLKVMSVFAASFRLYNAMVVGFCMA